MKLLSNHKMLEKKPSSFRREGGVDAAWRLSAATWRRRGADVKAAWGRRGGGVTAAWGWRGGVVRAAWTLRGAAWGHRRGGVRAA